MGRVSGSPAATQPAFWTLQLVLSHCYGWLLELLGGTVLFGRGAKANNHVCSMQIVVKIVLKYEISWKVVHYWMILNCTGLVDRQDIK